jgi:peptidoglycan/xylan/chitin deacetylase (PgdA/CDA1 family)
MLREIKLATLRLLKSGGVFDLVANSRWRQQRLLILCYHGISLQDEHLWRPGLYMEPAVLEQRFETLQRGKYSVLPLGESLERLRAGTLPPRSVAITFDDGTYDFYKQAYPRLKRYGFPVTVYQTTYYTDFERPVFNLITSYMLWKKRGESIADCQEIGLPGPMDLRTEASRHQIVLRLMAIADRQGMSGAQRDELSARLAKLLGIDYEGLVATRMLQLMNARELREVASSGVDVQLHTHRHRTPEDEALFRREIQDNRARIRALASNWARHFCYPSGVYRSTFFPWLTQEQVVSATTCDAGLATRNSQMLLIPRFVDTQNKTGTDFESWLSGVGDLLAVRRTASQNYVPAET